jgi:hypothetical protein
LVRACADPVGSGFVTSLAHPGGNVTGMSALAPDLAGKRLELLKEVVPGAARVAVLWNSSNQSKVAEWKDTQDAAPTVGLTLRSLEARSPEELDGAEAGALATYGTNRADLWRRSASYVDKIAQYRPQINGVPSASPARKTRTASSWRLVSQLSQSHCAAEQRDELATCRKWHESRWFPPLCGPRRSIHSLFSGRSGLNEDGRSEFDPAKRLTVAGWN